VNIVDIISTTAPTLRDICEMADPVGHVAAAGRRFCFRPIDLQSVKASGVAFAVSLSRRAKVYYQQI
jgi:fumarylacetoacetate (FAA) hydrolase family protein